METGGRWHPAARDFVKRWVQFGMAIGENHEPDLMNPVVRKTYAARIAAFRANVSLALAIAVANTLLYGADHLSKGNVVLPPTTPALTRTWTRMPSRCKRESRASALDVTRGQPRSFC